MKFVFNICFSLLLISGYSCSKSNNDSKAGSDSSNILKVMTYNIHIANPPSAPNVVDVEAIAKVINNVKPDLVALQEVDRFTDRSGKDLDQAKKLAELTGMEYRFFKAIDRSNGEYGLAILSRFAIEESQVFSLPVEQGTGAELRALGLVRVKYKNDQELIFATTHLDHLADANRELQSKEILKAFKSYQKYPIILGGDFNMNQSNTTWNTLKLAFNVPCTMCPPTHSASNPQTAIDYIILNNVAKNVFTVKSYNTYPETYASDHLPVVVELKY
ncbi:hypothetical protein PIECOFPK_02077 [Mycovorax composti]|jgi:Metal-dependent hydrolase|uniref:Endonuclease/exonuclease/phosphatase domain-containing protein n=2 Tax=Chitinophagaceae TaxID=563835 RepID=A0ABZ2ELF8_9BACT